MNRLRARLSARWPALLALAIPCCAGIAYLIAFAASAHYAPTNALALLAGAGWILFGTGPARTVGRRVLSLGLLALLAVPLLTGPELNGVARWLPLGPVTLHSGMLALPALAVLASLEEDYGAPLLLAALFLVLLQPDAASVYALTFACAGLHHVSQDWKIGAVATVGFFAGLYAAIHGELAPQPFVERVLVDALLQAPLAGLGLALALAAGFVLMLQAASLPRSARFALAGSLFGFVLMSVVSNYPGPLIGYGASPILGYALALGLSRRSPDDASPLPSRLPGA